MRWARRRGNWTVRHLKDVSEALSIVGYAIEPDPEDGTERIEDGTVVQVFPVLRPDEIACP